MKKHILYIICLILMISGIANGAPDSRITFNQGIEAFKGGNYSSSELLFRKTLENNDEYRDRAWFYLCKTIYKQQKYKAAIFEFNSFLTKCRTENLRIESRFWIGESYYNLNEYIKAIEEYNRFLEKSDDNLLIISSHDRIASIYYKQMRYEEAIIEWNKAIHKSEDEEKNAVFTIKIGNALFQNKQYDDALDRLNPLLNARIENNEKAETRLLVGRIYQLQNNHKKALLFFNSIPRELVGIYPFHDMYYFRALSYLAQYKESLAKSDLEVFYTIGKKSEYYTDGMFELGKILINTSKPESGIEMLVSIWETGDKTDLAAKSGLLLAQYYLEKEPLQSVRYLEKYLTVNDDDLKKKILITLSKAYIKTGKYDKAELQLQTFSDNYPFDDSIDEVLFLKAMISLEMGEIDKASDIFDQIKKEHPFSKFLNDSEYYMALVNYKKGKYADSIANLKSYLKKRDINNDFGAHLLLNELYLITEDMKNAEKELLILLKKYPQYSGMDRVLFNFSVKMFEKRPESADRYFNMLQSMYPDSFYSSQVNYLYGNRYFHNMNYAKAIPYYEKFLSSNSEENRGNAFYNLIISYYQLKEYEKVVEILKNASVSSISEDQLKEIPLINARSCYKLERYSDVYAILKWEDIRTLNDDDSKMLIDSTIKTGDIETASKYIELVKNRPHIYINGLLILGNYYKDNKDLLKAQEIYSRIVISDEAEYLKDPARLELAIINTENGAYNTSLELLQQITSKEFSADRDSLIIINNFNSGDEKEGAELTELNLSIIKESRFEEKVLLLNILYRFEQNDEKNFLKYSSLLKKYKDDESYVNYLSARFYYEKENYDKAYNYFSRLIETDTIYTSEACYCLGRIILYQGKNRNNALRYYKIATDRQNDKSGYYFKCMIELSIINHEMKNDESAFKILNDIIKENYNIRYTSEAENLLEHFQKNLN